MSRHDIIILSIVISKDRKVLEFFGIQTNNRLDTIDSFGLKTLNKAKDLGFGYDNNQKDPERMPLKQAVERLIEWIPGEATIVTNEYFKVFLEELENEDIKLPSYTIKYLKEKEAAKEKVKDIKSVSARIAWKNYFYLLRKYKRKQEC